MSLFCLIISDNFSGDIEVDASGPSELDNFTCFSM